ncbi:MAG: hypothetical protein DRN15_06310 [Thermoprotei archaeon]|nr:MAG: hypothetical protein DRN15_06310 [Thermoprotei archaeon]
MFGVTSTHYNKSTIMDIEDYMGSVLKEGASCIEELLLALDALYPRKKNLILRELEKYPLLQYLIKNFRNFALKSYSKTAILLSQEILSPLIGSEFRVPLDVSELEDEITKLDLDLYALLSYIALREAYHNKSLKNLEVLIKLAEVIIDKIGDKEQFRSLRIGMYFYIYAVKRHTALKEALEKNLKEALELYRKRILSFTETCALFNVLYDIYNDIQDNASLRRELENIDIMLANMASYIYNNYHDHLQQMYSQFSESSELVREFYAGEELIFSWIMPSITEIYHVVRAKRILEKYFLMIPCLNVLREISETFMLPYSILKLILWMEYQLLRIEHVTLDFLLKHSNMLAIVLTAILIFEPLLKLTSLLASLLRFPLIPPLLVIERYVPVFSASIFSLIIAKYIIKELHKRVADKLRAKIVNRLENKLKSVKIKIEILHAMLGGVYPQIVQS